MTAALIRAEALRKTFGQFTALEDVTMEVNQGEVVCLIGPSGSGKTTLLRCLNQLETYEGGALWIGEELQGYRIRAGRVQRLSPRQAARQRRRTGMVFQRFNLFPHLTALENVMEGPVQVLGQRSAEAATAAHALLDRVGLAGKAGNYPAMLSGGQQQRVAIARALAMAPDVLLFDEPTSALDPELVGEVLSVMRELAAAGRTMVIVTHEIAFAREVADRILFLEAGRILEQGPARTLIDSPQHPRTQAFLSALRVSA